VLQASESTCGVLEPGRGDASIGTIFIAERLMATVVIVVGIVAALVTVGWFVTNRQHPEQAAGHDDRPPGTTSGELYGKADRPSGPDAETMDPDQLGGDHRPPKAGPSPDVPDPTLHREDD